MLAVINAVGFCQLGILHSFVAPGALLGSLHRILEWQISSSTRSAGLLGRLELHVFINRQASGRAGGVLTGTDSDDAEASRTNLYFVGVWWALAGHRNVVGRDQLVKRGIFPFGSEISTLTGGDTDQIALYTRNVDSSLRAVRPSRSRRTLCLLGKNVQSDRHYDNDADKTEYAAHVSLRNDNFTARLGWSQVTRVQSE